MKRTDEYLASTTKAILLLLAVAACDPAARAGEAYQLVSGIDLAKFAAAGGGGDSYVPVVSADGRFVLFASTANNLWEAGNGAPLPPLFPTPLNVYLRDRTNQTTALVSVNTSGAGGGNGDSLPVDISADGRYALFESEASDLVSGDTNNASDVFVRDLRNNVTVAVSVSPNGFPGNGASRSPSMTPDGRFVSFVSEASDLVAGDANGIPDIFVRDLQSGATTLASAGAKARVQPLAAGRGSESPQITPDGRYVAFFSMATNLAPNVPANGDVYVRDLAAGTTAWASSGAREAAKLALNTTNVVSYNHSISADGRYVAYEASPVTGNTYTGVILRYELSTGLTDLVYTNAAVTVAAYEEIHSLDMTPDGRFIAFIANTNGISGATTCIDVWDAQSGAGTLASGDPENRVSTNSICDWPAIDPSGRFVAFLSSAANLVTNDVPGDYQIYLRDLQEGATVLISADTNGVGSPVWSLAAPSLSTNGGLVAFESPDGGLVANDWNHASDVFVRDRAAARTALISAHHPDLPSRTANGLSFLSATPVSADGRYVAFASEADNLVPGETNGFRDVFVRDLASGTTVLVSGGTNGAGADGLSYEPSISPDGRYVAFTSGADNLVPGDNNGFQDVFVRDLQTGAITLASVNTNGTGPGNRDSYSPVIGAGGRYVVFRTRASNVAPVTGPTTENLVQRDLQGGITYALTASGAAAFDSTTPDARAVAYGKPDVVYVWDAQVRGRTWTNSGAYSTVANGAALTPDGRYLVSCLGSNLYLADIPAGTSRLVASTPSPGGTFTALQLSADGEWLACVRRNSTSGARQLVLYRLQTGESVVVDHAFNSTDPAAGGVSDSPAMSPDGRFIAYRSGATNLVSGDTNDVPDVFLYDRLSGANQLLSAVQPGGLSPNNRSLSPVFSADGHRVLFESWASDLVAGDFNWASDIFAYTLLSAAVVPGAGPGAAPVVQWPSAPGNNYRVEYKDRAEEPDWKPLAGTIINDGTKAWLQDASPSASRRFYRVVQF